MVLCLADVLCPPGDFIFLNSAVAANGIYRPPTPKKWSFHLYDRHIFKANNKIKKKQQQKNQYLLVTKFSEAVGEACAQSTQTSTHTYISLYLVKVAQHESCEVQQMYSSNKEAVFWQVMLFRACLGLWAFQGASGDH